MHNLAIAALSVLIILANMFGTSAQGVTYANTATAFNWIDASTHTKLGPTLGGVYSSLYRFSNTGGCGSTPPFIDDSLSSNIPIGFTFMYGGTNFTQVRIMSNGRLQFNNNMTCGFGSPVTQLPYPNASLDSTMRIYGGDLDPSLQSEIGGGYTTSCTDRTVCYVSYATLGTAPYRSFVVTWSHVPEWTSFSNASGDYNLQVILQENGEFIYQYGNSTPGPGHTTGQVGWQVNNTSADLEVPAIGFPVANTALKFYIPRPVAEYRMEQLSWNGTANEVLDTSGNSRHATAIALGGATRPQDVATGQVCRGGQMTENNTTAAISAIDTNIAIPTTVGNSGTISFWYNNAANSPSATRVLFDATTTAGRSFYLHRTNTRALTFTVTDSGNTNRTVTTTNNALPNTGWSHVAVSWTFNNLAAANSDRLRIWIDGTLTTTSGFTTNNVISNQIGTLYIGDNRSAASPVGRSAGDPGTSNATLDEFRLYNYEGGTALVNRDFSLTGACLSHYAVSHAGSGQACQANNVTVTAHDITHGLITMPNNTTQISLSTSTGEGDWTLISGYGVLNNGTANDGVASYLFNGEYQAVFALTHNTAGNVNINVTDGQIVEGASEDADLVLTACFANFNACHDHATTHCSAAQGKLFTRLAGINSSYDIVALDGSDNVATSFTGRTVVSLIARANAGTVDAQNCFTPSFTQVIDNAATDFTSGRLTLNTVSISDAYREARIKVVCDSTNCPPSGMTWCSVDNFAIRPAGFNVTADLGGPTLKAGYSFNMTADSGTATYDGTPVLDTALMRDHNSAVIGTLTGTFPVASGGSSTGSSFSYHDVGTISLLADAVKDTIYSNVDQPNDCVDGATSNTLSGGKYGCVAGSVVAGPFARFYPDHFDYAATLNTGCSGFVYMDHPVLGINLNLRALSSGGLVTSRYTDGYSQLGTFSITGDNSGSAVSLSRLEPALPAFTWINGSYLVGTTTAFKRLADPDGPYDSFALQANILTEPDGVAISGTNLSDTTRVRFGRIKISNQYGSELLPLDLQIATQYFNGSGWMTNALDSCTPLSANNFAYAFGGNLSACETAGTLTGSAPNFKLRLAAPNFGNDGVATLTLNLGAASIGNTCLAVGGTGPADTPSSQPWLSLPSGGNPSAQATFGIYRGNNSFIYYRENY